MLPPLHLYFAPLQQVNSLSCRDARLEAWRSIPFPAGPWGKKTRGNRALQATECRGSIPSGQHKPLGGSCRGSCMWQVSRVSDGLGNTGKEAGGCCFTVSRQSSSLQPPARNQRSVPRRAAGIATGHESLCRCAHPSLCKTERDRLNACGCVVRGAHGKQRPW